MNDDDREILASAREGFLEEAQEMLAQFEQSLLQLEANPDDHEILNAAFRAAHTIKGTAGIFGCQEVVAFTHEVETLMDELRNATVAYSDAMAAALLQSRDEMAFLLSMVRDGTSDRGEIDPRREALVTQLRQFLAPSAPMQSDAASAVGLPVDAPSASADVARWHISVRFKDDSLRYGLDPLAFIRYLSGMGEVSAITLLEQDIPTLERLDPESCYLGFEIELLSASTHREIENVFEFARDDCDLVILPPDSDSVAWQDLLSLMSQGDECAADALQEIWRIHGVGMTSAQPGRGQKDADVQTKVDSITPVISSQPAPLARRSGHDRRAEEPRHVKVRADKLDRLIDLIGELVIAGSGAQMVANQACHSAFIEAAQRVADLVQETRDGALALRMVPIGETFSRFQRVVRDVGKQLDKKVELVISGGDTELDKSMVDLVADPLMHLVRNSLDHGLETPEERVKAGKTAEGHLGLHAYQEAGSIVIEVSDDGRGLQRQRIVSKAVERGLIQADANLSDEDVWQLVFAAGFSTAETITDISGRGVGMDVVRRNIEALRGQISLASHEGIGTTLQIRLPLTLAMIDGFLTQVGGVHYVLPLAVICECVDEPTESRRQPAQTHGTFDLRGEVLPYLNLASFYGLASPAQARRSAVIVSDGKHRMGLIVDRLMGEHQTVIKPLAPMFQGLEGVAGSTIMGSGEVALVLDLIGLMRLAAAPIGKAH
jgi:two-component system, chemotaxis family, sensor kinase CheA